MSNLSELPTGTVTFLFTDVEGSTRLLKQLGERYGDVLDAHQSILRAAFAEAHGQEIDTQGDSFFVAFSRAKDAVAAALEGQRALAAHRWPDGADLRVRMGVHTGEPVVGSDRYVGLDVHRAARIMAAGHGGQILLSNATRELIEDNLAAGVSLRDLAEHRLKDLDRPEHLFQVIAEGLASEFPPLRTQDAPTAYSGLEDELAVAAQAAIAPSLRVPRRLLVAALCAGTAAAAVAIGVLVVGKGGTARADLHVEPNSAVAVDADTGRLVAAVPVGSGPVRVAAGAGAVWVVNGNAGTVSKIDPAKRAVAQTIDVGSGPAGIAVGDGAAWVTNASDGTLSQINADASRVVKTIPLPQGPRGVAYGAGAVWVANLDDRSVSRVDPRTDAVRTIPTGGTPTAIAVGAGAVWVTNESGSSISKIDPRTNTVVQTVNVGNGPGAIAVGLGSVWVANTLDGTISRIDARTGTVTGTVPVGEGPRDVAVGRAAVWVANEFSGTVSRIDPRTNGVTASSATGSRPTGLAVAGGSVWATVRPAGVAHRGGTLSFAYRANPIDSLDPALSYSSETWQILSLTGDGLTAFTRVGGSEGATVVPDLAVALATPTDGGKTYTFQLRRGIRYSTGALVEPRDIRAAIERDFELGSPGVGYYAAIAGASACRKGTRCDLSRGIVVAGDTIVFHLTTPSPEFLQRLALPFAYAVPATTPGRVAGGRALPATGPYAIVRYDPKRQLRLERNPHFREWSRAARPDGYPDAIVMKIGISDDAATTAVEHGRLDYTGHVAHNRIEEVETRYADLVHVSPTPGTNFLLMNTRIAPFDSVAARRAVSYALDRSALVKRAGGPRVAAPTCQILPPNFPGYEPYCPFTAGPTKSGGWRAPDLTKARELISRSGTVGMHVTVLSLADTYSESVADEVVQMLGRLGYTAARTAVPYGTLSTSPVFSGSRSGMQIAVPGGWFADYPSPGGFIQPPLSCRSSLNDSGFCDRRLDDEMRQAQSLEPTDPRAADAQWAHIDHELVDAAPWIPYSNGKSRDFVSKRVGNFQFHPQWAVLLDQLWVR